MSITKQLRAIGPMLGLGCGDNSCLFLGHTGAGTNGGCQCDLAGAVRKLVNNSTRFEVSHNVFAAREPMVEAMLALWEDQNDDRWAKGWHHEMSRVCQWLRDYGKVAK